MSLTLLKLASKIKRKQEERTHLRQMTASYFWSVKEESDAFN